MREGQGQGELLSEGVAVGPGLAAGFVAILHNSLNNTYMVLLCVCYNVVDCNCLYIIFDAANNSMKTHLMLLLCLLLLATARAFTLEGIW